VNTDTQERLLLGSAPFSVMARVAMQLGRESISNSIIAITELVKNAYDADAEEVSIRFQGLNTTNPVLVISDNGIGMTETQLRENWMVIGTPNKATTSRSVGKKRVLTGEKGLGRLGLDRLCQVAIVQSFTEDRPRGIELVVDWSKYENNFDKLEDIAHNIYSISKNVKDPVMGLPIRVAQGTYIVLQGLKDQWSEDFLRELKQELSLLISPFSGKNDFTISISSGMDWKGFDGKIGSSEILDAAEWQIIAEINKESKVSYTMSSPQFANIFTLLQTPWSERFKGKNDSSECGSLRFEMYFYPRKDVNIEDISFSRKQVSDFLDVNQGVRIYRDGFRVKPYGQPNGEGDWLTLSYRRQQSPGGVTQNGWRVGYNQVVGAVFLTKYDNPNLIDQTNREGIVEGQAFNDMRMFVRDAIGFFETNRVRFERERLQEDSLEKVREQAEEKTKESAIVVKNLQGTAQQVSEILETVRDTGDVERLNQAKSLLQDVVVEVSETVSNAQEAQRKFAEATREQEAEFQRQKDTLANLASLGILAAGFGHETLGSSNLVLANAKLLQDNIKDGLFMVMPDLRDEIEQSLDTLLYETGKIETFAEFMLQNVSRDKRERKAVRLDTVVRKIFAYFQKSLSEKNIVVEFDFPLDGVRPVLAFEIDWQSIFLNLITNSVWAIVESSSIVRKIRVKMKENSENLEIRFADSGCGLAAGTERNIFLPTFSTKRSEDGIIVGTGMGLTIVKSFVGEYRNGSIDVISPCDLGGAEFVIALTIPDLSNRGDRKE
jgi:signal transduction histidine kinase